MRLLPVVLLLALASACKDKPKFIPPPDAGPICEGNTQLIEGVCRFVCQRDGDCAAGEGCNLFTGQCQVKPPPPDAGPPPGTCTEGAIRCSTDKKSIETCQANATWSTTTTCPPPSGFCQNEKCLVCQPGVGTCASMTTLNVCLDDGSATRTVTCSGAATCQSNECRECAPNTYRCNPGNTAVQHCEKTGDETATWKWVSVGDNFDGNCITQQCRTGGVNGFECVPPACFPGQIQCASLTVAQTCNATGAWTSMNCPASAECQGGICVDECTDAVNAKSYFGCDFWTAVQDNSVHPVFKANVMSGQGALGANSEFAFVVANRSINAATVTVSRYFGGALQTLPTVNVPGRNDAATKGVAIIKVPWQSISPATVPTGQANTGTARYGYRLQSTKPLTVYQFNPLGASFADQTRNCNNPNQCSGASPDPTCVNGKCNFYAYSNDASLLLPAHILGMSYVAMTSDHVMYRAPDPTSNATPPPVANTILSIVATQDNTTVTLKPSARTLASVTGTAVPAIIRNGTQIFTLQSYDVLQVVSDNPANPAGPTYNLPDSTNGCQETGGNAPGSITCTFGLCQYFCRTDQADLTGSIVTSDKPIAVFGSSSCTQYGPADSACDHIEEQMFPFTTWGKDFVATRTAPLRLTNGSFATAANAGPDYYKIVAGCPLTTCPNGTSLTLTPPPAAADVLANSHCIAGSLQLNTCRLGGGQYIEFRSKTSFTITADQPIAVGQFFAGQNATAGTVRPDQGDPSFVLLPPVQQWRSNYTILTAPGTRDNYLGMVVDTNKVMSVTVDGNPVSGWAGITGTTFQTVNAPVTNGTHVISVIPRAGVSMGVGAGVTVYGFDSYVSYGYTGGLDLQTIVTGINPGG